LKLVNVLWRFFVEQGEGKKGLRNKKEIIKSLFQHLRKLDEGETMKMTFGMTKKE
jgi:hypothetical protein